MLRLAGAGLKCRLPLQSRRSEDGSALLSESHSTRQGKENHLPYLPVSQVRTPSGSPSRLYPFPPALGRRRHASPPRPSRRGPGLAAHEQRRVAPGVCLLVRGISSSIGGWGFVGSPHSKAIPHGRPHREQRRLRDRARDGDPGALGFHGDGDSGTFPGSARWVGGTMVGPMWGW